MLKNLHVVTLLLLAGLATETYAAPQVDPKLETIGDKQGDNCIFGRSAGIDPARVIDEVKKKRSSFSSRAALLDAYNNALKSHADQVQGPLLELIKTASTKKSAGGYTVKQHPLSGLITIRGGDKELVEMLKTAPGISKIWLGAKYDQKKSTRQAQPVKQDGVNQWGIDFIEVPKVWAQGNKGKEVVVGIIGPGARATHEAIKGNHRATYGWFDPGSFSDAPSETGSDHGTMATSIIVGQTKNIGVAPDAKWIACKTTDNDGHEDECKIADCLTWMACPTDPKGQNPKCGEAPKVIHNAWSANPSARSDLALPIKNLVDMGILMIFSAGADSQGCGNVLFPSGEQKAVTVGGVTKEKKPVATSSRGPSADDANVIKPDCVAPGSGVFGAVSSADDLYALEESADYAAPFVSGLAALYLTTNPNGTVEGFKNALFKTATATVPSNENCGGVQESQYPNNHVGYGLINALSLVNTPEVTTTLSPGQHIAGASTNKPIVSGVLIIPVTILIRYRFYKAT